MDTRELFARLLRCEAGGEGEDGMKAVATCTMNRVRVADGEFRDVCRGDLRRVIEQACQYSCYKSKIAGKPNTQNVWVSTPGPEHYRVADWAINGGIHTGSGGRSLWYMNPFQPKCPNFFPYNKTGYWFTRVNQHCFYNPTDAYFKT